MDRMKEVTGFNDEIYRTCRSQAESILSILFILSKNQVSV